MRGACRCAGDRRASGCERMTGALQALFVVGGLLPLAAMLAALFAAVWLRQGGSS